MKKFLIATFLSSFLLVAHAKETVTIVYSWGVGDSVATVNRAMIKEANEIQNKYLFLFEAKPGAGGSIASNYVLNNPNTILVTSSAFFIRPVVYPNESYNLNNFQTLLTQFDCSMAIVSKKYKSWAEVPKDKQLNIGTSGLGVTTHLAAVQITTKYPNVQIVPFKATSESLLSMVAGNTDFHVGFLSEPEARANELNVLGITGRTPIKKYQPLTQQGFSNILSDMNVPFQLVVPTSVSDTKYAEWQDILRKAMRSQEVRTLYSVDHCIGTESRTDMRGFYRTQREMWHRLASKINIDQK